MESRGSLPCSEDSVLCQIPNQFNSIHIFTHYFFYINVNIIQQTIPLKFSHYNSVRILAYRYCTNGEQQPVTLPVAACTFLGTTLMCYMTHSAQSSLNGSTPTSISLDFLNTLGGAMCLLEGRDQNVQTDERPDCKLPNYLTSDSRNC
jgi:hypothetical protein